MPRQLHFGEKKSFLINKKFVLSSYKRHQHMHQFNILEPTLFSYEYRPSIDTLKQFILKQLIYSFEAGNQLQKVQALSPLVITVSLSCIYLAPPQNISSRHGDWSISNSREGQALDSRTGLAQGLAWQGRGWGYRVCKERKKTWTRWPKKNHPFPKSGTSSHTGVLDILLEASL